MACNYPLTIRRKDTLNPIGMASDLVPCGKCIECKKRRRFEWAFRLTQEYKYAHTATWLTLTYDQENVPTSFNGWHSLQFRDIQLMLKKLRKKTSKMHMHKIKYFGVGEYGEATKRPHYHVLLFNMPYEFIEFPKRFTFWDKGDIFQAEANIATIMYTAKYMLKSSWEPEGELDDREKPKQFQSQGIGEKFLTEQMIKFLKQTEQTYLEVDAIGSVLPRYYRKKVYTLAEQNERAYKALKNALEQDITTREDEYITVRRIRQKEYEQKKRQYEINEKSVFAIL